MQPSLGHPRVRLVIAVVALAMLALSSPVVAQITLVPTFAVGPSPLTEEALNVEVAVGTDGSILFAWTGYAGSPHVSTRKVSTAGLPLGVPQAISGDGCDPTCVLERVLGGGGATTDCDAAWTIDNPANLPLLNKTGSFNGTQLCTDNDPRCDFDGGVPGGCTFHVRACANLTDVDNCTPPTRLASWELLRPSTAQAARRPEIAAVRNAFAPVPGAIVGPDQRNVCSDWLAVPVLLRGSPGRFAAGKVGLKSTAVTYGGDRDTDKLKLVCLPTVP